MLYGKHRKKGECNEHFNSEELNNCRYMAIIPQNYCWWFRNPANQWRLVDIPLLTGFYTSPGGAGIQSSTVVVRQKTIGQTFRSVNSVIGSNPSTFQKSTSHFFHFWPQGYSSEGYSSPLQFSVFARKFFEIWGITLKFFVCFELYKLYWSFLNVLGLFSKFFWVCRIILKFFFLGIILFFPECLSAGENVLEDF